MLERMARYYGKEAAANDKPRVSGSDPDFIRWMLESAVEMELHGDDFADHMDLLIDAWEFGYDEYKNGEII